MTARRYRARSTPVPAIAAIAVLAVAFGATLLLPPWSDESVGDLGVRSSYAATMLDGELPYRDFDFEYPPLAWPAIALPGALGVAEGDYRLGIAILSFLLIAASVLLAGALAARTGGSAAAAMLAVAVGPLLIGAVARLHFDSLAVALTLGALLALLLRRPALGMGLLGLGAMTKGFPLVAAPVALAWLWAGGDRRGAVRGGASLAATLAAVGAVWVALSPQGALDSVTYHLDRPVQLESSPASALFLAGELGGEAPSVVDSHRSAGLDHSLEATVAAGFALALLLSLAAMAAFAARAGRGPPRLRAGRGSGEPDPAAARALVLGGLAAVAAFAAFGRVLSPQYLVWVLPLLSLAVAWRMRALATLCAAACVLTLAEFPSRYLDLVEGERLAVAITAVRNTALIAAVVIAGTALWRMAPASAARTSPSALSPAPRAPARSIGPARPAPRR